MLGHRTIMWHDWRLGFAFSTTVTSLAWTDSCDHETRGSRWLESPWHVATSRLITGSRSAYLHGEDDCTTKITNSNHQPRNKKTLRGKINHEKKVYLKRGWGRNTFLSTATEISWSCHQLTTVISTGRGADALRTFNKTETPLRQHNRAGLSPLAPPEEIPAKKRCKQTKWRLENETTTRRSFQDVDCLLRDENNKCCNAHASYLWPIRNREVEWRRKMAKNGGRLRNTLPPPVFEWRCIDPIECLRWACHASVGFHPAWFTPRQATWAHFFVCFFYEVNAHHHHTHTHTPFPAQPSPVLMLTTSSSTTPDLKPETDN